MNRGAVLSPDGVYRYRLWRTWATEPHCAFLMLNPSTADAEKDDPTIRRCVGYAKAWGHGGLEVVNLFALRTVDPRVLLREVYAGRGLDFAIGPDNDEHILRVARCVSRIVLAWGSHGAIEHRNERVIQLLERAGAGPRLAWLASTANGEPRHPLRLRADLQPKAWDD